MEYKVIPVKTAREDLEHITQYIAQDNPKKAVEWVDKLKDYGDTLKKFPLRGKKYNQTYRVLVVENGYRIFYRVNEKTKEVIIIHFFSPYQNVPDDI